MRKQHARSARPSTAKPGEKYRPTSQEQISPNQHGASRARLLPGGHGPEAEVCISARCLCRTKARAVNGGAGKYRPDHEDLTLNLPGR